MYINTLMNLTGAPAHCWLLSLVYVCALLNVTASPALNGITPMQALTGQVPDIKHFLYFSFWEPVYYKADENEPDHRFPSYSGFADNKAINLLGRYSLMKLNRLLQDLLTDLTENTERHTFKAPCC